MGRTSSFTIPSMVGIVSRAPAVDEKGWCFFVRFFFVILSRFGMTKMVITETLWSSIIFKTIMVSLHRGKFVVVPLCSSFPIDPHNFSRGGGKYLPKITIFGDFWGCKATSLKLQQQHLAWRCGPRAPFARQNFVKNHLRGHTPFGENLYQKLPFLAMF